MQKKILIIDDSPSIREFVSDTLEKENYTVTSADNGQTGLDLVKENTYDLIISDIHMPQVNGIEFTRKVRTLEKHQFTPILILTTEFDVEKKMEGIQAGATGWIVKPIVAEQLINTVSRIL